jgi:hypothetical protein
MLHFGQSNPSEPADCLRLLFVLFVPFQDAVGFGKTGEGFTGPEDDPQPLELLFVLFVPFQDPLGFGKTGGGFTGPEEDPQPLELFVPLQEALVFGKDGFADAPHPLDPPDEPQLPGATVGAVPDELFQPPPPVARAATTG